VEDRGAPDYCAEDRTRLVVRADVNTSEQPRAAVSESARTPAGDNGSALYTFRQFSLKQPS
jgi:hypothetical protein